MRGRGWTRKAALTVASLVVCAVAVGLGYFMGNYAMTAISTGRRVSQPAPVVAPSEPAPQAPPAAKPPVAIEPTPAASNSGLLTDLDDASPATAPAVSGARPAASPGAPAAARAPAPALPLFRVQVGPFATRQEAVSLAGRLLADGYQSYVTADRPYRVQVGAFSRRDTAERLATELKGKAYANVKVLDPAE